MKAVFHIHDKQELLAFLANAQRWRVDKPIRVTVEHEFRQRTLPQNSLLHALFSEIALFTGHTAEEIKDFLVRKLAGEEEIVIGREVHRRRRSTAQMEVDEMTTLVEQIMAWASIELGMVFHMEQEKNFA